MKLRDVYGQLIAGKGSVLNVQIPQTLSFTKERDPQSIALENKVAMEMSKAIESVTKQEGKKLPKPPDKIRIVSYEEAKKELSNGFKPSDDKS